MIGIKEKIKKGMFLFLACFLFLSAFSKAGFAGHDNSLTIYKYRNKEKYDITQNPRKDSRKVSGAVFTIFKLGEKDKESKLGSEEADTILKDLSQLSAKELEKRYPVSHTTSPTNSEGMTKLDQVEEGRYLLIETTGTEKNLQKSSLTAPLLVDLPLEISGNKKSDVVVYPKGTLINPPHPEEPKDRAGESFYKYEEGTKTPVPGAQFQLFKEDKGPYLDGDGKKVFSTSNNNGYFEFTNLPYGNYFIREMAAPTGYIGSSNYYPFTVTADSLKDDISKNIYNKKDNRKPSQGPGKGVDGRPRNGGDSPTSSTGGKNFTGTIPKTGDIQIYLYIIAGLALIAVGILLYKSDTEERRSILSVK
ncbi:MAG: SpaA isopeptide-forming pilin-related protein [Gallicola sp.]|nr:SpaA isopeptide-forming pilin-related protein [Gallicola sp.]